MPVFKGAMKVARQNLGLILMYIGIVALVLSLTIRSSGSAQPDTYAASAMKISFVDEDNSVLSQALEAHLSQIHTLTKEENDPVKLMENLYYRQSDYVLRIPAGFGADPEGNPLQVTEVPGSYTGVYLENQIESYLRQIRLYETAGFTEKEAVSLADQAISPEITVLEQSGEKASSLGGFYQFIPYGAICMLSYAVGNVLCAFLKTEIRKRTGASAFTHRRTEWELLLAVVVFGLVIFAVFLLMGTAICGKIFWTTPHLGYYLSNMAVMILVSLSLSYVIAMLANGPEALSGIVNSISLGMSFLCGVFVPLEVLGDGVKSAAHFLPFYWYERANLMLTEFPALSHSQLTEFLGFLGIQAAFAVAFLSLGAAIHKKKNT